jgi:hypothetical protein
MLAQSLALLISVAQVGTPPARSQPSASAQADVAAFVPKLVPYGTADGIWISATLLQDGYLNAVLEDALGQTIFGLIGKIGPNGEVHGRLYAMEVSTSAALALPQLEVQGKIVLPGAEAGSISLVIFNPLEDLGYVYPRGYIDGVLTSGLRPMTKPGQQGHQSVEMGQMQTPGHSQGSASERLGIQTRGDVISCPWAPGRNHAVDVDDSGQAVTRSGMIVCPFEPKTSVKSKTALGTMSKMGHAAASNTKMSGAASAGTLGAAGGISSPQMEQGWMFARWTLLY